MRLVRPPPNFVGRPVGMTNRHFIRFVLSKRWNLHPKLNRVYLGKTVGPKNILSIREWMTEQPGQWTCSDGNDCFYFSDQNTAFMFKMRWAGAQTEE